MGSRSSSSSSMVSTNHDDGGGGGSTLLEEWASHSSSDYHDFGPDEAAAIRTALLDWYRAHRRKLPWRGDPPPYDGSTAGINNGGDGNGKGRGSGKGKGRNGKARKKGKDVDKDQPSISKFFVSKKDGKPTKKAKTARSKASDDSSAAATQGEEKKEDVDAPSSADDDDAEAASQRLPITAYGVWVSEIMLQQTRVEAVIPYYLRWMSKFPTVHHLAAATEEEVNAHWAGLGFYRRARLLHAGAKRVVNDHDGEVPDTVEQLKQIDGIGPYTASAIASIAFGVTVPVVDGNVCRVLARLRGVANHIKATALKDDGRGGWKLAAQIVEAGDGRYAGEVNQALMELGATYCAPSGSGIDERDPLRDLYLSTKIGREVAAARRRQEQEQEQDSFFDVDDFVSRANAVARGRSDKCSLCDADGISTVLFEISRGLSEEPKSDLVCLDVAAASIGHGAFPTAPPKKAKREEVLAVAVIRRVGGDGDEEQFLMVRRPKNGLLAGQWEFPSVCVWSSSKGEDNDNKKKGKKKNSKKKGNSKATEVEVALVEPGERSDALDDFLAGISSSESETESENKGNYSDAFVCDRKHVGKTPVEHIFSHVRHTMWLEYGEISEAVVSDVASDLATADGREARLMTESDMASVGITSGVKKVLATVKKTKLTSNQSSKKRKRTK